MPYPPGARPDPPAERLQARVTPHLEAEARANARQRGVKPTLDTSLLRQLATAPIDHLLLDLHDPRLPEPGTMEGERPSREFIAQVEAAGIIRMPLYGQWNSDGSIKILDGRRRYRAGHIIGERLAIQTITILVWPEDSPGWLLTLEANNARAENVGSDLWAIKEGRDLGAAVLARLAGMPLARLRARQALMKTVPQVLQHRLVHGGSITPTVARAVAKAAPSVQEAAVTLVEGGQALTTRTVNELSDVLGGEAAEGVTASGEVVTWPGRVRRHLGAALQEIPGEEFALRDLLDRALGLLNSREGR